MITSAVGIKFIEDVEGFKSTAYSDGGGVWTIGFGTIRVDGKLVKEGDTCTLEEAKQYLLDEIHLIENKITKLVKVQLTQNQFDALVSFCYNLGVPAFAGSTLLKLLNAGDYVGAGDQILRWNKDNGVVVKGLTNRRKKEREMFVG